MKQISLFALFSVVSVSLFSQTDSLPSQRLKPYSVNIGGGLSLYSDPFLDVNDFRKIAPGSTMLMNDFSGYDAGSYMYYGNSPLNGFFAMSVEFVPWNKRTRTYKNYTNFHAGIMINGNVINGTDYGLQTATRFDTITSSGGMDFYLDSMQSRYYSFEWMQQMLGVDIGQVFHTDDRRIFSCWMGYGLQAGIGLNTQFRGHYSRTDYISMTLSTTPGGYPGNYVYSSSENQVETIRTASVAYGRVYIPFGFQLRFSRKQNAWNKLAYTLEGRINMDVQEVPGLGVVSRFFYTQSWGLRYYFQNNATK